MFKRGGLGAGCGFAIDERQMDRAVRVGVSDRSAYAGIHNLKRNLLAALPGKCPAGRFTGFDLPSDELPVSPQRLADRPPPEELAASAADDAAYDLDHFLFIFHPVSPNAHSVA